jgi:hypothetical protein
MGYEFLIKVNLTANEKDELIKMFKRKLNYSYDVRTDDEGRFEFKDASSQSQMPDFTIAFEGGGIYICQNRTSEVWANLSDVREWLLKHKKGFDVEEL